MAKKKFKETDILINTMRTHPVCEFFIYDSKVYYNNESEQSGTFNEYLKGVEPGYISLYEYNIDRRSAADAAANPSNDIIFSFITKDSSGGEFKTVTDSSASSMWTTSSIGDVLYGIYPFSASITREYWNKAGDRNINTRPPNVAIADADEVWEGVPKYPHYWAIKNRLNFYGNRSRHYLVSSSQDVYDGRDTPGMAWDKDDQQIGFISIPSIFFGSRIEPGSVSLKWYYTGSLAGELQDKKRNGELIQVSGGTYATDYNDEVAGVIMYDEGFILLTGSWNLMSADEKIQLLPIGGNSNPKWRLWGAGCRDGVSTSAGANYISASFKLSFRATSDTQVMTMFAHARKGEVNYSNNPTYLTYVTAASPAPEGSLPGQIKITSSHIYEENPDRPITNFVSSSFPGHSASFKRQVYVSRVAIYDEEQNLIGVATLANPVLKQEDQDFTFKLKLDI